MATAGDLFLTGEVRRTVDDRFRISFPMEMSEPLTAAADENGEPEPECVLVKERYGCLSLWRKDDWQDHFAEGVGIIRQKMKAGRLAGRWDEVQRLGRLLSTRDQEVKFAGRGRLLIPETFRSFLGVEAGGECVLVGAALCVEIWHPTAWTEHLREAMPEFNPLFKSLTE